QLAHYEHLVEVEGAVWNAELVMRGANERLIPILMTAAVTALGLAPLAFGLNRPGQEIEGPMAVTVLGGLLSSTLLNLLVLPALAQRYVRVSATGLSMRISLLAWRLNKYHRGAGRGNKHERREGLVATNVVEIHGAARRAANRMQLMPFTQIATRIGGAITITLTLLVLAHLG